MWLQTAEILMILRPESEPISDFQDYTLVAVIAVATHLMGSHAGDHHFLAALAMRFSQDATALHQVRSCPPPLSFLPLPLLPPPSSSPPPPRGVPPSCADKHQVVCFVLLSIIMKCVSGSGHVPCQRLTLLRCLLLLVSKPSCMDSMH